MANLDKIKNISIVEYLKENYSMTPEKKGHGKAYYRSPFGRTQLERTPSLIVNLNTNTFKDWGIGVSGDIFNLVQLAHKVDFATAVKILSENTLNNISFSFKRKENYADASQITKICEIQHIALENYITERCVNLCVAKKYCKQIHYVNQGKRSEYFALGFMNDKGGYELSIKGFKRAILSKSITTIKGNPEQLNLFEGFFDFLSCLSYYKTDRLKYETIVLNTTANYHLVESLLSNYKQINLFLDNDKTGKQLAEKIALKHNVRNMTEELFPAGRYEKVKDFNDFLQYQAKACREPKISAH